MTRLLVLLVLAAAVTACEDASRSSERRSNAELVTVATEAEAFAAARRDRKGVIVLFVAEWDLPSRELDQTLHDTASRRLRSRWVLWRIDVTEGTDADFDLKDRFGVVTTPLMVFLDEDGRELERIQNAASAEELVKRAETVVGRGDP